MTMKSYCGHSDARYRGNCYRCYHRLYKQVKAKKITWQQLEKQGLASPPLDKKVRRWIEPPPLDAINSHPFE